MRLWQIFGGAVLLCTFLNIVAENILVALPLPLYSHTNAFMPLFQGLASRGHQLTIISPFPQKPRNPNITDITTSIDLPTLFQNLGNFNPLKIRGIVAQFTGLLTFCKILTKAAFEVLEDSLPKIPSSAKFDLVIIAPFFCQESLVGLGNKYSAPIVAVHINRMTSVMAYVSGNPFPFAYVPHSFLASTDNMDFLERTYNAIISTADILRAICFEYPFQNEEMQKYFGPLPHIQDIIQNISLILLGDHYSFGYPRPYQRNIVEVGGIGIKKLEPLSSDLDKYMNDSKNGVIFFSWGSHFRQSNVEPKKLATIISTFRLLKERLIIKWENETIADLPPNVLVRKWVPQNSILNHPNLRLFITHGGINSITEAAYHGVPIVGTPLFADQPHNIELAKKLGLGLSIEIEDVTEESFFNVIREVIDNPKFKQNAVKRAEIMKDRPQPILENAIYWVEYVMRHKGAPHLRPSSLNLSWYQLLLLDVILFLFTVIAIVIFILYKILRSIYRLIFACRKTERQMKSKQVKKKQQ